MFNLLLAASVFIGLFVLLFSSVLAGRAFASWQAKREAVHKVQVVSVAEGAVFALLGLLIAFTFSGAYERFENRKFYIIEESNAIKMAYSRIDLLAPSTQEHLREEMRAYVDSRIAIYKLLPHFEDARKELFRSQALSAQIWKDVIAACHITNSEAATMLVVPAFNSVFDMAHTRFAVRLIHPPIAIFVLLIGLAVMSSFLAGYSTVGKRAYNVIYIISYAAITAFTLYIIIDLEMPRLGAIRVDKFDHLLVETREDLK